MYKTVGIIGGMGPAATADLMLKIIDMTDAACDQEHIPMLIDNNTNIPDRTAAILEGGEDPVPEMLRSAKRLEQAGADFLIIACNTAHYFIKELSEEIHIPILNMPAETASAMKAKGIGCAAVLATNGTDRTGLYERALEDEGIKVIYPLPEQQELIMSLIYDYIKKGVVDPDKLPRDDVKAILDDLRARGSEAFLLACTELPIAFELMGFYDSSCIDSTRMLAEAAVREAGAPYKPNTLLL